MGALPSVAVGPHRPGDIRLYSFWLFNTEMAGHCCFFFNKSLDSAGFSHQLTFVASSPRLSVPHWTWLQGSSQVCISAVCLRPPLPHGGVPVEGWHPGTPQLQPVPT